MSACELVNCQYITFRINGHIYYGPIKRIYQTFNGKILDVFYDGNWYPAKIVGEAKEKAIYNINATLLYCSPDLILKTPTGDISVDKLKNGDEICCNMIECDEIFSLDNDQKYYINSKEVTTDVSDWLFGVEFVDENNKYYTLTNGMIVSTK